MIGNQRAGASSATILRERLHARELALVFRLGRVEAGRLAFACASSSSMRSSA